jgi:predicted transposase/invertase (TIGR01784 family)
LQIPANLNKLLTDVISVLLDRIETPPQAIAEITDLVEKKGEQTMFEGFVEAVLEDRRLGREEGLREGREEAEEKARQEKLEIARNMKVDGQAADKIAKYTGLSPEDIAGL